MGIEGTRARSRGGTRITIFLVPLLVAALAASVAVLVGRLDLAGGGPPAPTTRVAGVPGAAAVVSTARGADPAATTTGPAASRPNVVLFLVDDATVGDLAALPTVRARIGDRGTRFTRAFSAHPLCCPARASLLTGQHSHNHGVQSNVLPWGGVTKLRDDETLPVWLQRAGYRTLMLGKYLNGYDVLPGEVPRRDVPPGWTEWHVPAINAYDYRSYTMNHNGRLQHHTAYQTDLWHRTAVDLVDRYAPQERPFFLWAGFLAPHTGGPDEPDDPRTLTGAKASLPTAAVPERDRDAFAGLTLPRKASFGEPDLSDKQGLGAWGKPMRPRWEYREAVQQRRESLLSVDRAVGAVLDRLAAHGELDDTLLVFASDNGYLLGEHQMARKVLGYEESVRVPLLVRGPGFARGVTRRQLVSLTDLPSTVARATGAQPTLTQDGRPLQPLSRDSRVGADRVVLLQAGPYPGVSGPRRLYTGIRTPDRRVLLRWHTGDVELYHLDEDPLQLRGGLDGTETRRERDALIARLDRLQDCVGRACDG